MPPSNVDLWLQLALSQGWEWEKRGKKQISSSLSVSWDRSPLFQVSGQKDWLLPEIVLPVPTAECSELACSWVQGGKERSLWRRELTSTSLIVHGLTFLLVPCTTVYVSAVT